MKVKLKLKIKGRWWLRLSSKCSKLMITPLYLRKLRLNKSPSQSRRTKVLPPKQSPNNYQTPSRTCLRLKDNPTWTRWCLWCKIWWAWVSNLIPMQHKAKPRVTRPHRQTSSNNSTWCATHAWCSSRCLTTTTRAWWPPSYRTIKEMAPNSSNSNNSSSLWACLEWCRWWIPSRCREWTLVWWCQASTPRIRPIIVLLLEDTRTTSEMFCIRARTSWMLTRRGCCKKPLTKNVRLAASRV